MIFMAVQTTEINVLSIDSLGIWITSSKTKFKAVQKRQTNLNDEEKVSYDVAWLEIHRTLNETINQEAFMQENIYKYSLHIVPALTLFPFYQKIFLSAILYRLHNSWLIFNAAWTLKWWKTLYCTFGLILQKIPCGFVCMTGF